MLLKNFHGQCRALQPVIYKIALIIFSYWPFSFYSNFTQTDFRNIKLHFSKFANTKEISNKLHSIPLNLFLQVFFFIETLKQSVNCKNLLFLVLQNCCMLIENSIFKLIKKIQKVIGSELSRLERVDQRIKMKAGKKGSVFNGFNLLSVSLVV